MMSDKAIDMKLRNLKLYVYEELYKKRVYYI